MTNVILAHDKRNLGIVVMNTIVVMIMAIYQPIQHVGCTSAAFLPMYLRPLKSTKVRYNRSAEGILLDLVFFSAFEESQ
jgi:hypothetical protein